MEHPPPDMSILIIMLAIAFGLTMCVYDCTNRPTDYHGICRYECRPLIEKTKIYWDCMDECLEKGNGCNRRARIDETVKRGWSCMPTEETWWEYFVGQESIPKLKNNIKGERK